jgi:hypothetical protein
MLIFVLFNTRSPHPQWLNFLWIIYSKSMACLILLSLIVIQHSPAIFGKNCSSSREPNFISSPPIIPKLMDKLKLSTSVWKHICGVLHRTNKINGPNSYPLAEWWYNTSYHTTTHMTPFEAIYGQKPLSILSYMPSVSKCSIPNHLGWATPHNFPSDTINN